MNINNKTPQFVAKALESILVIGYILFEELVWNIFAKPIFSYIKSLVVLEPLKQKFLTMHRYLLLTVFIGILVLAESMGFLAGLWFLEGYFISGILVYVLKIPVAAFTFWLFDLTKAQLMTFAWLEIAYEWIMGMIDKLLNSAIHVYIRNRIMVIRQKMQLIMGQYFGKVGFVASIKSHYKVFKPYLARFLKN
ncbi:MAG: hypothetical protein HON51_12235 [Gammaproteobacteria bacterium]|jgi:hypothetical protein|nr:hypothetical protein [Gammaproteobacteria bacterium]MBT5966909.1 hypothetical protein [Gammaproteobacteria bacterium]MBT6419549.1 hypothetical protein [Gammaproteobacteria bacterium]MBT6576966.1 hypothetical protein [Gammaproteobacteria bacterium]MBT7435734.1 hypothetical protein [Gammaproteobacteria bacterium]